MKTETVSALAGLLASPLVVAFLLWLRIVYCRFRNYYDRR